MENNNNPETLPHDTFQSEFLSSINQHVLVVECPHCSNYSTIMLNELNCCIFRHGVFKHNGEQINPHLSKEGCDELFNNDLIYGCGRPFRIIHINENNYKVIICDYI